MAEPNNPVGGYQPEDSYYVWALALTDGLEGSPQISNILYPIQFDGPAFDPHFTVVGDLRLRRDEAIARFHSPVATLKPYTARNSGVAYKSFFYQCVYLLIDPFRWRRGGGGRAVDLGGVLAGVTSRLNLHLGTMLLTMFTTECTFGRRSTNEEEASAE